MIDTKVLAASTLQLLQADPSRYRCFGVFWYLIKAVLKKYYTQDNLFLLGDYVDIEISSQPQWLILADDHHLRQQASLFGFFARGERSA